MENIGALITRSVKSSAGLALGLATFLLKVQFTRCQTVQELELGVWRQGGSWDWPLPRTLFFSRSQTGATGNPHTDGWRLCFSQENQMGVLLGLFPPSWGA